MFELGLREQMMRVRLKKINKMNSMIFNCPLKKNQAKKVKRKDHRTRSTSKMRLNKVKRWNNRKVKKSSQW